MKNSCRHTENTSHKTFENFLPKIPKQFLSRSKKYGTAKTPEKTEFSTNDPLNLLNAALRAVVKLYNQKFDNFLLKSELKAERVPVKHLKKGSSGHVGGSFENPTKKQSTKDRRKKVQ